MPSGAYSTDDGQDDILSIGNSGLTRRITNVSAGINATDAATVGQLQGLGSGILSPGPKATPTASVSGILSQAQTYTNNATSGILGSAQNYAAGLFSSANAYTDQSSANTLSSAKSYTDNSSASALSSARTYADGVGATTLSSSKSYTDNSVSLALTSANNFATGVRHVHARIGQDLCRPGWREQPGRREVLCRQRRCGIEQLCRPGRANNAYGRRRLTPDNSAQRRSVRRSFMPAGVGSSTLSTANIYSDTVGATTLSAAKTYTDTLSASALASAKSYADSVGTASNSYADQVGANTTSPAPRVTLIHPAQQRWEPPRHTRTGSALRP